MNDVILGLLMAGCFVLLLALGGALLVGIACAFYSIIVIPTGQFIDRISEIISEKVKNIDF